MRISPILGVAGVAMASFFRRQVPPPTTPAPLDNIGGDVTSSGPSTFPTSIVPPILTCATVRCSEGTVCEMVDGRPKCIQDTDGDGKGDDGGELGAVVCGDDFCAEGKYCCNRSCGICVPIGGSCIMQECK